MTQQVSTMNNTADLLMINLTNMPERPVYPYAFVQVSALARKAGLSVVRWDGLGLTQSQRLHCISKLVEKHQPRSIGFTIRQADTTVGSDYIDSSNGESLSDAWFPVEDTKEAIEHIRRISEAIILIGGFTFTAAPEKTLDYLQGDVGIMGEADDLFRKFDQVLSGDFEGVANLIYSGSTGWIKNERVYYPPHDGLEYTSEIVNEIALFHGDRVLRKSHLESYPGLGTADDSMLSIAIEISRGCPFSCSFCCEPLVKGKKVNFRPVDVVEQEIRNLLEHGLRYYWFVCSELNHGARSRRYILELAQRVIEINKTLELPIVWRAYFLPIKFSKSDLRILLRSGLMIEQNGPFSSLDDKTLAVMHEPYRSKHAIEHIIHFMELDKEPEFEARKLPRWVLWAWPTNPYATLDSIRNTLIKFSEEGLDLKYDEVESYPALRVYDAILPALPSNEDIKQNTIVITRETTTPKNIVHPAFYYSTDLLTHFGGIVGLQNFLAYAHDTLLSRRYRMSRDWSGFYKQLDQKTFSLLCSEVGENTFFELPKAGWLEHPDLGDLNPPLWLERAEQVLNSNEDRFNDSLTSLSTQEQNVMTGCLLALVFMANRHSLSSVLNDLGIDSDDNDLPPLSPFKILKVLLCKFSSNDELIIFVTENYSSQEVLLLEYYLFALNIRLDSSLEFLSQC